MSTAVVVGAGPNGLAAAATLARAGVEVTVLEAADLIGGGTRSSELTLPGLLHDHCSGFHPMGIASPVLRGLGISWRWAEVDLAHPLDDGRAATLTRGAGSGTIRAIGDRFDDLMTDLFRPVVHAPRHPLLLARFGPRALQPATVVARQWRTEEDRALFAGIAAHGAAPLSWPTTAAIGLVLGSAGHRYGWPVAEGGSRAISDALAAVIIGHGGRIETGVMVTELPHADVVLLDVAPAAVIALAGDRLPGRIARAYRRYRHGPAAFKLDLAVDGGIPWLNEDCGRAGTVHVGGTLEEIAAGERAVHDGRMPERPFVLVGQQYLADPTRSRGDVHPVWAYCHVPAGYDADAAPLILAQINRFAPGFLDRIVAQHATTPAEWSSYNANFIGGDILTGANTPWQTVVRPRLAADPYWTGIPGVYLCSAATPPGGGVHGMCGFNAARSALRHLSPADPSIAHDG
jgi:phytoene dehydrogenase-like protein